MTIDTTINISNSTDYNFTTTYSTTLSQIPNFIAVSGCVIDHIIETNLLSSSEKLYYLVNDFYNQSAKYWQNNKSKKYSSDKVKFSANKIGSLLGFTKSKVFKIQRKLEILEYLQVNRSTNTFNMNNVNVINTTLPEHIFSQLMLRANSKSMFNAISSNVDILPEQRRDIITQTKQFIPLNFNLLRFIFFHKNLSCNSKLLYLKLFCIINKIKKKYNYPIYAGGIETDTLLKECNISRSTLLRCMKQLQENYLIKCEKIKTESSVKSSNRFDKIINYIQILIPKELEHVLLNTKTVISSDSSSNINDSKDNCSEHVSNGSSAAKTYMPIDQSTDENTVEDKSAVSKKYPPCVKIIPFILINKNINTELDKEKIDKKEKIENTKTKDPIKTNKSISNFEEISLSFEEKSNCDELQPPLLQQQNQKTKSEISEEKAETKLTTNKFFEKKTLTDFYPLSSNDCDELQKRSNKPFSLNVMNEILKSLTNKLINPLFYSKRSFMSYMVKVFAYELRNPIKVNNDNYKILVNMDQKERKTYEMEKFLHYIENNKQMSHENTFKKKLANALEPETAYNLLKNFKAMTTINDKAIIKLYRHVEVTELEKNKIIMQARSVFDNMSLEQEKGFAVQDIELIMPSKNKAQNKINQDHANTDFNTTNDKNTKIEVAPRTGIWGDIRTKIAEYLGKDGDAIDANCFSKLYAEIDEQTKQIRLRASSRLYRNYIYDNYVKQIDEATISCSFIFEGIYSEDDPDKIFTVWRKQN